MTDIERRALLGDKQAQEECTEKGILLACPFCGDGSAVSFIETDEQPYANHTQGFVLCHSCWFSSDVFLSRKIALSKWNTRHAPTIGRCKDCANKENATVNSKGFLICPASGMEITDTDFCSYFEPRCHDAT